MKYSLQLTNFSDKSHRLVNLYVSKIKKWKGPDATHCTVMKTTSTIEAELVWCKKINACCISDHMHRAPWLELAEDACLEDLSLE